MWAITRKKGLVFSWQVLRTVFISNLIINCGDFRVASSEIGNPPGGTGKGVVLADAGLPARGSRVSLFPSRKERVGDLGSSMISYFFLHV